MKYSGIMKERRRERKDKSNEGERVRERKDKSNEGEIAGREEEGLERFILELREHRMAFN